MFSFVFSCRRDLKSNGFQVTKFTAQIDSDEEHRQILVPLCTTCARGPILLPPCIAGQVIKTGEHNCLVLESLVHHKTPDSGCDLDTLRGPCSSLHWVVTTEDWYAGYTFPQSPAASRILSTWQLQEAGDCGQLKMTGLVKYLSSV